MCTSNHRFLNSLPHPRLKKDTCLTTFSPPPPLTQRRPGALQARRMYHSPSEKLERLMLEHDAELDRSPSTAFVTMKKEFLLNGFASSGGRSVNDGVSKSSEELFQFFSQLQADSRHEHLVEENMMLRTRLLALEKKKDRSSSTFASPPYLSSSSSRTSGASPPKNALDDDPFRYIRETRQQQYQYQQQQQQQQQLQQGYQQRSPPPYFSSPPAGPIRLSPMLFPSSSSLPPPAGKSYAASQPTQQPAHSSPSSRTHHDSVSRLLDMSPILERDRKTNGQPHGYDNPNNADEYSRVRRLGGNKLPLPKFRNIHLAF